MCIFAPELRTHCFKVRSLYKAAMRSIEAYYVARVLMPRTTVSSRSRYIVRYHQVLLRARFDEKKSITDPMEQRRLLWLGQEDVFKTKHPIACMKFAYSYGIAGGVAPERVVQPPDWVLDYWHPLEKAQYPIYFKKREQRKCEYIQLWNAGQLR